MFIQMGLASDCRCESAACLVSEGGADGKYGQEGDPGQKNEFFSIWISGFYCPLLDDDDASVCFC